MKNTKKKKQDNQMPYAWRRIDEYFEILDEEGPGEELWNMLKLAMVADNDLLEPRDRSNMLFFYEHTKELFEHIYKLLQQQKKNNETKKQA